MNQTVFRYNPFDADVMADPLPYYRVLRDEHPVYYIDELDTYALSRFDDIWTVIKHAIKPAAMPVSGAQAEGWFLAAGYQLLPVMAAQVLAVAGLPAIHQDPFDRLLVAQAQTEGLLLLSADRLVLQYPGTTDASR